MEEDKVEKLNNSENKHLNSEKKMGFDEVDDFIYNVIGIIGSDQKNLSFAVDFALELTEKKSFSPNTLLDLSNACKQEKMVMEEYVFAKACFIRASGKLREDACFALGTAAHVLGFYLEAEASYLEALKENPDNGDVRCAYAELLLELGKTEDAEKEYKTVLEASPEHVKANAGYAYLLAEYGYVREAEECYSNALTVDPDYVPARGGYANLLFELGRLRDAEKEYRLAIELDPEDPSLHHNCGVLLSFLGRFSEAEIEYREALSLNPRHRRTLFNYGNLLAKEGRVSEAEAQYMEALALDQNDAKVHSNYANLLARFGRRYEAEMEYKKALSLDPESAEGHYSYGNLLSEIGRFSEAQNQYEKALVLNPYYPPLHYSYGLLMRKMGRFNEAKKEYMKAMQLDPDIGSKMVGTDFHKLTNDEDSDARSKIVRTVISPLSHIPDKQRFWARLHRLAINENANERFRAAYDIGCTFAQIPDKQQAWNDLVKLSTDKNSDVRIWAVEVLGSVYSHVPNKQQAWNDLIKLTSDQDSYTRYKATSTLGSAFFHMPDKYKQQLWNDLIKLTSDQDDYVKVNAYHSLGRIAIFKASQSRSEEVYLEELKKAIEFFEKAANKPTWNNPSRFCFPFYNSFYTIICAKKREEEDEVANYLSEAKNEIEGSKYKKLLLEIVINLENALKEVQSLGNLDLETKKDKLNFYRQYCDRAEELMRNIEEKAPSATEVIRKGLPILDRNLKGLIEEIQEKAKIACRESKGTEAEEIVCEFNREVQEREIIDAEELKQFLEDMVYSLKRKIIDVPDNEYLLNKVESMRNEKNTGKKLRTLSFIIENLPTIKVVSKQELEQQLSPIHQTLDNIFDNTNLIFNEIANINNKLSCISFDISKIKLNSADVISNLKTMKQELEKLSKIEGLNTLSIEKSDSMHAEKLNGLSNSILERFDEIKILIQMFSKDNDKFYQEFSKRLNELKQSKSDTLLQRYSALISLISFAMAGIQVVR